MVRGVCGKHHAQGHAAPVQLREAVREAVLRRLSRLLRVSLVWEVERDVIPKGCRLALGAWGALGGLGTGRSCLGSCQLLHVQACLRPDWNCSRWACLTVAFTCTAVIPRIAFS